MLKVIQQSDADFAETVEALVNRSNVDLTEKDETVRAILGDVRAEGDGALLRYTERFDGNAFEAGDLKVTPEEIRAAYGAVSGEQAAALRNAADNIRRFHERQKQESWRYEEDGALLGQMVRPLATAGIYVPGGKAAYPSSVLMNAVPARVAGVKRIVMVSPAPGGQVNPAVLVAADIAGVSDIFKVGGAQAVAAMAFGTATVPRVDKIVGPGNIYVALAKRLVFGVVDIDMIAGPSEILIIADDSARADFVAADLLSQAEHDEEAVPVLITDSAPLARHVVEELKSQTAALPRRTIIETCLSSRCRLLVVDSLEAALLLANRVAPEHLELAIREPERWLDSIENAGAVFLGHYTPEAVGDYFAGPNHVLPTSGTARFSSPLGVYDFIKKTSVIGYSQEKLRKIAGQVRILAEMEHLSAHANAVKLRE